MYLENLGQHFYHRYEGVYEIEHEAIFWNTSYSHVLIKSPHFSCSCRNEEQRLDAFQIYYLCDALNYKKAMSENNTFLNIKLKYTSQLYFTIAALESRCPYRQKHSLNLVFLLEFGHD